MRLTSLSLCLVALMLPVAGSAQTGAVARADLKMADGKAVGEATLRETPNGVLVKIVVHDLAAGPHAFHIHTAGKCDAPDFATAGGHFAPGGTHHGLLTQTPPHAGDLPNMFVGADGKASVELLAAVTLGPGERSLFDADGSALVLHAGADDYMTDPAGNAGGRIACGVITR